MLSRSSLIWFIKSNTELLFVPAVSLSIAGLHLETCLSEQNEKLLSHGTRPFIPFHEVIIHVKTDEGTKGKIKSKENAGRRRKVLYITH